MKGEKKDIREGLKEWVTKFLKEKLDMECKVELQVKWKGYNSKTRKYRRKNRLKGGFIFIENDLTWEEGKNQERIIKQAKEGKSKEENIKIGIGKVRVKGIWKYWEEK